MKFNSLSFCASKCVVFAVCLFVCREIWSISETFLCTLLFIIIIFEKNECNLMNFNLTITTTAHTSFHSISNRRKSFNTFYKNQKKNPVNFNLVFCSGKISQKFHFKNIFFSIKKKESLKKIIQFNQPDHQIFWLTKANSNVMYNMFNVF